MIGNSTWASNSFIDFNGNSDLAINSMNWLSSDEDLISIRPKPPEDRQLTMTSNQMRWVRSPANSSCRWSWCWPASASGGGGGNVA